MQNFIHRTIESDSEGIETAEEGKIGIRFTRTRTSGGFRTIVATLGTQKIEFTSDLFGDNYEQVALQFARGLEEMASEACSLPVVKEGK